MRRSVLLVGLGLWTLVFVAGGWLAAKSRQPAEATPIERLAAEPRVEARIPDGWQPPVVDDFTLVDQTGAEVTPETLAGEQYVVGFIFTRCATHCPDLLGKMVELEQSLGAFDGRLLTVTVDPSYDDAERMAKYADIYTEDADRWKFLTGEPEELLKLVRYGHLNLLSEPPEIGKDIAPPTPDDLAPSIAHSLRLMHVGPDGRIRGSYHYRDPDDLTRLRRVLRGKAETAEENRVRPPFDQMVYVEVDPVTGKETVLQPPGAERAEDAERAGGTGEGGGAEAEETEEPEEVDADDADPLAGLPSWARRLPLVNASLNGLATLLLLGGWVAIKSRHTHAHRAAMSAAVLASAAFLACYLAYHWALGAYTDSHGRPFTGSGAAVPIYYGILISHVLLAIAVPVLVAMSLWRAYRGRWQAHRRIARVTFPIWLYVSVTGVVIYAMLYHWPA